MQTRKKAKLRGGSVVEGFCTPGCYSEQNWMILCFTSMQSLRGATEDWGIFLPQLLQRKASDIGNGHCPNLRKSSYYLVRTEISVKPCSMSTSFICFEYGFTPEIKHTSNFQKAPPHACASVIRRHRRVLANIFSLSTPTLHPRSFPLSP